MEGRANQSSHIDTGEEQNQKRASPLESALSPRVYPEEPPTFDEAFTTSTSGRKSRSARMSTSSNHRPNFGDPSSSNTSSDQASQAKATAVQQISQQLNGYARHNRSFSATRGGGKADAIGGTLRGTVATGDLGPQDDFESLEDLRSQVGELETDYML